MVARTELTVFPSVSVNMVNIYLATSRPGKYPLSTSTSLNNCYAIFVLVSGLPHAMDSAMSWSGNKRTYFFRDGNYWKLDDGTLKMAPGYPRDITKIWMKCAAK